MAARWEGAGALGGKGKKIKKYKLSSHGYVKYGIGNKVSNIVTTSCGVRWVLDLSGWSLHKLYKFIITTLYT